MNSRFGLSEAHFEILNEIVIFPLKSAGAKVFIFGSRAAGKHHNNSDIDVLYRCSSPFERTAISQIREAIEESNLPYKVDLVDENSLASGYRASVYAQLVEV